MGSNRLPLSLYFAGTSFSDERVAWQVAGLAPGDEMAFELRLGLGLSRWGWALGLGLGLGLKAARGSVGVGWG